MVWPSFPEFGFRSSLDLLFEVYMIWGPTAQATKNRKGGEKKKSTDKKESESLGKET